MRAVVWTAYGAPDVLEQRRVPRPVPEEKEILVRVRATTVTAGEIELRRATHRGLLGILLRLFFGVRRPRKGRILGQEFAGEIVAVGDQVTTFAVGDRVVAQTGLQFGGYAEFACQPEASMVVSLPDAVSFEQAVTLPTGGLYAWYFVQTADIGPGDSVLINGAGGSIGTYALQLAARAGASITAVDGRDKLDLLRDLGADHVIDYASEDFTRNEGRYDAILDVIDGSSFGRAANALRSGGRYLHSDVSPLEAVRRLLSRSRDGRHALFVRGRGGRQALETLAGMIAAGELRSVIDRRFPLEEIAAAHTYAESGAKRGHIVITVEGGSD